MQKRAPRRVAISFSGEPLTHYGGIYLLQFFFKRLKLRKQLHHHLQFRQRNNRYTIAEEMLALIYPISLGLGRIETSHLLKYNGVFQYLTGLPTYPNPTTLWNWGTLLTMFNNFIASHAFIAFIAFVAFIASVLLKAPPNLKSPDLLQEIHFLLEDGVNHLIEFQFFVGRPFDKKGFNFFIQIYRNLKLGDRAIKFSLFRL
jgi:hypothetical protein